MPERDLTVVATDHAFELPTFNAGRSKITCRNDGKELHHFIAFPLNPGKTVEDLKASSPLKDHRLATTGALEEGTEWGCSTGEVAEVKLKAGKYAFVCFLTDRAGGPPHFTKGMLLETEVSG